MKRVEQGFRADEIGSSEPLGEPLVDGRQEASRRAPAPLSVPEPGEARRCPQLPGESVLTLRPVDGLPEELLGRRSGVRSTRLEDDLPFDAEQLGAYQHPS